MRIARLLALAGIDSRRKCEVHITNGAVSVNGQIIRDLGRQVDPANDAVLFRGRPVVIDQTVCYVMNKPVGYTTTAADPYSKKTVFDLLPRTLVARTARPSKARVRVFPVGRLDKDSSGLLLFTNDGDLANKLTHPRYEMPKLYEVRLDRAFEPKDGRLLIEGFRFPEGHAHADKVQPVTRRIVRVQVKEGKNREVRRLFDRAGYEVVTLCRLALGPLSLGLLQPGRGRFLSPKEIEALKKASGGE